jgi:hypothetical protein
MQSTEDGNLHDTGVLGESMRIKLLLDRVIDRLRDSGSEGGVRPCLVVVGDVLPEDEAEVVLGEGDEVVEAFSADGADEALAEGVGTGGAVGRPGKRCQSCARVSLGKGDEMT